MPRKAVLRPPLFCSKRLAADKERKQDKQQQWQTAGETTLAVIVSLSHTLCGRDSGGTLARFLAGRGEVDQRVAIGQQLMAHCATGWGNAGAATGGSWGNVRPRSLETANLDRPSDSLARKFCSLAAEAVATAASPEAADASTVDKVRCMPLLLSFTRSGADACCQPQR